MRMCVMDVERDFDLASAQAAWNQIRPGEPLTLGGHYRRKDGSVFPVEVRFGCFDLRGERHYVGLVRDLSERELAEAKLRRSEADLREAQRVARIGNWRLDLATKKLRWSEELFRIFAMEPAGEGPAFEQFLQRVHPEDRPKLVLGDPVPTTEDGATEMEYRVVLPTGAEKTLRSLSYAQRNWAGEVVELFGTAQDVTARRLLEAQVRQAQKLEAIGQLAGGVAHDFNNILAAIMMQAGCLRLAPHLDEETKNTLIEVERTAKRGAALTRQMLLFSRRSPPALQALDLDALVADLLKMLRRLIGENVRLQFEAGLEVPVVEADAGMLEQVLTNLVVNARDAMPEGGTITITASAIHFGESDGRTNPSRRAGCFACLAVSDTGCGMNAETLKHLFEPFFTTKEVGRGTGLGLATVHGIVAQHQGWVEVESAGGQGTTFRVYLPAAPGTVPTQGQETESPNLPRGKGTVLLVEDERAVRQALGAALRQLGYSVQEAASGEEALGLWLTVGDQVDLLLTDMVMPGRMTGRQLAEQLRGLKPGLKVIISSGYSAEIANASQTPEPGVAYLPKPYDLAKLVQLLGEVWPGGRPPPSRWGRPAT